MDGGRTMDGRWDNWTPAETRAACGGICAEAKHVRLYGEAAEGLAGELAEIWPAEQVHELDAEVHYTLADGEPEMVAGYVLALDAINFGSGYFPALSVARGDQRRFGYNDVARPLKDWLRREPEVLRAETLAEEKLSGEQLAEELLLPDCAEALELAGLFRQALAELGRFVSAEFGGRYLRLVEGTGESALTLVRTLLRMPMFRDGRSWRGNWIPFLKRAQIAACDLHLALKPAGLASFRDLHELTIFADNALPYILREAGLLVVTDELAERVDRERALLAAGSEEEIELRAATVWIVEELKRLLDTQGGIQTTAVELDHILWNRAQQTRRSERGKGYRPHLCRCIDY